jgi:hypothetical protein
MSTRDDEFWCDELIIAVSWLASRILYTTELMQVETVRFKVPRRLFEDSEVFQDMFAIPQATSSARAFDGSCEQQPLILEGILAVDFKHLLRHLFPRCAYPSNSRPLRLIQTNMLPLYH